MNAVSINCLCGKRFEKEVYNNRVVCPYCNLVYVRIYDVFTNLYEWVLEGDEEL